MSDWIEPEVDWDIEKEPQPADLNRIENDLKHLKEGNTEFEGNKSFTNPVDMPSINTGHGDVECYGMDQSVKTTDSVVFDTVEVTSNLKLNVQSKGVQSISSSSSWTVPQGVYYFMSRSDSRVEINISTGSWQTAAYEDLGIVISDGSNVRIRNLGATRDFYYLKF